MVSGFDSGPQLAAGGEIDHGLELPQNLATIVDKALALFQGKPDEDFLKNGWATDAVFEDPITLTNGYDQFAPQWYGLAKVFKSSVTEAYKVTRFDDRLVEFELRQAYTVEATGTKKTMQSLVHIELDEAGRVVRFEDRWDAKPIESGAAGTAARKLNAKSVPHMVKVPAKEE